MYCKKCGKELPAEAKFCKYCGTPVSGTITVNAKPGEKKVKRSRLPLIVASFSVILIFTIGGFFLWRTITNIKENLEAKSSITYQNQIQAQDDTEDLSQQTEEQSQPEKQAEESPLPEEQEVSENDEEEVESEYFIPESDSRYLTMDELEGYTEDDCRIARNELYARHGRKFSDEFLLTYFESKSWYEGTIEPEDFDESVFNEYEIANRDLIVEYEKKMGYRG